MPINMPLFAYISMIDNVLHGITASLPPPALSLPGVVFGVQEKNFLIQSVRQIILLFNSQFNSGITQSFCHFQVHLFIRFFVDDRPDPTDTLLPGYVITASQRYIQYSHSVCQFALRI